MKHRIDRLGIRELEYDPDVGASIYGYARDAVRIAKLIAPKRSGEYARRMFVQRGAGATVYYGTHSYKGWWVEYGTVNNPAHHVLTNAAIAVHMQIRARSKPGGGPLS